MEERGGRGEGEEGSGRGKRGGEWGERRRGEGKRKKRGGGEGRGEGRGGERAAVGVRKQEKHGQAATPREGGGWRAAVDPICPSARLRHRAPRHPHGLQRAQLQSEVPSH